MQVVVRLDRGQYCEAVVERVRHARRVVHLDEVRDEARRYDYREHDLGELFARAVRLAVGHRLASPADYRLGAHCAERYAHRVGVERRVAARGYGAFVMLRHRVAHSGPEVFDGRVRDYLRVDEDVVRWDFRERIFAEASVGVIYDAEARAGRAGRGYRREGEEGPLRVVREHLACVDGLAAADGEDHVSVRRLRAQHLDVLERGLAAVPVDAGDFYLRALYRLEYLVLRRGERLFSADDDGLSAVLPAYARYVVVGVRAYRVSRKHCPVHLKFCSFRLFFVLL